MRRVAWRLLPCLGIIYIINFLDRVNVGFAALQMNRDLGFTASVYGAGAGIFFIGYFLVEIPSNLALARFGARRWIARIMITWGAVSMATALTYDANSFFVLRFLLGIAEAGLVPGVFLYMTYWFPPEDRARATSVFLASTAVSIILGGPISTGILSLGDMMGVRAWQWLFIIEGIPAVLIGFWVLFFLTDRPQDAKWLTMEQREWLAIRLSTEDARKTQHGIVGLLPALRSGKVWGLSAIEFCIGLAIYGLVLWLPQIVKQLTGVSTLTVGFISAAPFIFAGIAMVVVGLHSDRSGERRWHLALSAAVGAVGLIAAAMAADPMLTMVFITVAACGIWSALGLFWTVPPGFLTGAAAAGGLALINSIANLSGFAGPYAIGVLRGLIPKLWNRDSLGFPDAGLF
jgi:ACS family tartrate transporter-like MFS transporter